VGTVCIVWLHASLVHSYGALFVFCHFHHWAWFVLFHRTFHWFFFNGHGIYMFTSLTGSSLLGIMCTVALPSLVHHYWAWFVLFHFMLHWFFNTGHGSFWFTSCFTCSSWLVMVCSVSLSSLMDHYLAWFVFVHFMFHLFFLTGHGYYCSTSLTGSSLINMICIYHFKLHLGFYSFNSRFTDSSLLGMVYIVSLHAVLVPPYWSRFVLFHFPH
jgi:hypothetical protein